MGQYPAGNSHNGTPHVKSLITWSGLLLNRLPCITLPTAWSTNYCSGYFELQYGRNGAYGRQAPQICDSYVSYLSGRWRLV